MHESRMMAEVAPPGCCAMPKVSGSRIATPLAPPRPGSTPMITPSTMPVNISSRFFVDSAMTKPCASAWISSTSVQPEKSFHRALGQRHLEPQLEHQEEHHHGADAHRHDLPPAVLAEPAHEEGDEGDRGDVEPDPGHQQHVERAWHQHRQHRLQLLRLDEGLVARLAREQRAN